jgi:hypothetical protein
MPFMADSRWDVEAGTRCEAQEGDLLTTVVVPGPKPFVVVRRHTSFLCNRLPDARADKRLFIGDLAFNTLDSVLRRNVYRVDLKTNGRRVLRASKQCGDALE